MNGRVYAPELGRFLSADPYVQIPETTKGFNRYAYGFNNPLSFTDPSGFFVSDHGKSDGMGGNTYGGGPGSEGNDGYGGGHSGDTAGGVDDSDGNSEQTTSSTTGEVQTANALVNGALNAGARYGPRAVKAVEKAISAIAVAAGLKAVEKEKEKEKETDLDTPVDLAPPLPGRSEQPVDVVTPEAPDAAVPETGTPVATTEEEQSKRFSEEKSALVDMAKQDKRTGVTQEDMDAYQELNDELDDPFPQDQVRGLEEHLDRSYDKPHGHIGPVDHIPGK